MSILLCCKRKIASGSQPRTRMEDPTIKVMQAQIKLSQAEIKALKGKLIPKSEDKNNLDDKDQHVNLTCRKCQKKWHIAKNCPEKNEGGTKTKGAANNKDKDKDSKKTGLMSPFKIPPRTMSQSSKIGNVEATWCDCCK